MAQTHLALFETQREIVQRQVAAVSHEWGLPPWRCFFLVADVRSQLGRDVALRLTDRVDVDRTIREAEACGEPPVLTVPLVDVLGLAIVRLFYPELAAQVLSRPPLTVAILIVDKNDDPLIGIGRLVDGRYAVS